MTTIQRIKENSPTLFFASTQFWLCNILGWLAFDLAQGIRDSFDGSPLIANIIKYFPTAMLGIVAGLCVHCLYKKLQWHTHHPMRLTPIAGLFAIAFASLNIFINHFDLVLSLPETCSRQYSHTPNHCGIVSDFFLKSMGAMLIWCLFYFLIQSERNKYQNYQFRTLDAVYAITSLILLKHLGTFLSVIAYTEWGNTYYLFSKKYIVDVISGIPLTILFASFAIFIKPRNIFLGSRILPLTPLLCTMSFCFTALTIGAESAFSRLIYLQTNNNASLYSYIYYIFFGASYGNFSDTNMLAGILQGGFIDNLSIALFFISYRYATYYKIEHGNIYAQIDANKTLIFWSYNFLYWLFFGLLIYATDMMGLVELGRSVPLTSAISFAGIGIFMGALLRSKIEFLITTKTTLITLGVKIFAASLIVGILLTSTLWIINYTYIYVILKGFQIENYKLFVRNEDYVFASILASSLLCGLWSLICYMIESQNVQRNSTIKQLQIEMNMKEVQLNALAGKIDPHFIFNALNNIRALVDEDSEKARSAIVVLSDILRSPITNNSQNKVHAEEEMLLVRNYISLSKIQFEDRLIYKEDVGEDVNTALIPAMMLQILVENAIKHGISQLPDGGVLSLAIRKREQQLVCTISNDGSLPLNSGTSGFGVGIKAIQERLTLLYDKNASFSLREMDNNVVAELILPFEIPA